jgi:site-specific recombinase XerD
MTQHNNLDSKIGMTTPTDIQQNWLDHLHRQGKSRHTLLAYQRGVQHFSRWYIVTYGDGFVPKAVMPRDVRDWKAYQQTVEKAAPATINQRLVALNRFFRWARTQALCLENPTEAVGNLRLAARQPKALPNPALRRLLRAARSHVRDYALLELLAGTGLRVGELLALKVVDVDLGERSGKVTVRQGKHGHYREVPLTIDVRKALVTYLETAHPDPTNPATPLWVGTRGELSHRSSVTRLLAKYALQAGIEPVNPHALRHTFATRYLNANPGDLRGLARLLGHTSLDTVMIYTEPTMQELTTRMERVEVAEIQLEA